MLKSLTLTCGLLGFTLAAHANVAIPTLTLTELPGGVVTYQWDDGPGTHGDLGPVAHNGALGANAEFWAASIPFASGFTLPTSRSPVEFATVEPAEPGQNFIFT